MSTSEPTEQKTPSRVAELSREVVRLYARSYGRGPTKARAYIENDFALVILEEIMTPAEHTLVEAGETERVVGSRLAFQEAVRPQFNEIAERITGRKVRAFFSQVHVATDMAQELYIFEPIDRNGQTYDGGEGHEAKNRR